MRPYHFALALACVAAGCGGSARSLAPVTGRVTLDGRPAAGVHVSFQPVATAKDRNPGGGSYAITDADGRYALKLVESGDAGAFVGSHRVEITTRAEADDLHDTRPKSAPKTPVPPKYNRDSTLTWEVKPGPNEANFDLKSR